MFTLNCNGRPVELSKPLIMGILNYTEDSFYPGSRVKNDNDALRKATLMVEEGADIIDIGAQSTRPGSERLNADEEIKKIGHLIPALRNSTDKLISIDTYHAEVAQRAVELGADIVNDISGGTMDEKMIETVGHLKVPYICMHIKGTPENMQRHTNYKDILDEILGFFIHKIDQCRLAGIHDIIIDPGFGFAKTPHQNLFLLKNLPVFKILGKPVLAGLSRKSTIYKLLHTTSEAALNGTTVLNTLAIQNGAQILRVHDVKEAKEVVTLMGQYLCNT